MTYKSILCLNGALPSKAFFDQHALPLVAADGAANTLIAMGVYPDIIIGDGDSVMPALKKDMILVEDQNFCDYEKALAYIHSHDLAPSIITGLVGGDLDHIVHNLHVFSVLPLGHMVYTPSQRLLLFGKGDHVLSVPTHTKVSFFGAPEGVVTAKDLVWPLEDFTVVFPRQASFANRTVAKSLCLTILSGHVLIAIEHT